MSSRLAGAQKMLRDVHASTDDVLVGLSGGKDSLVTLDMCVKEFGKKHVQAYFMYFVKGLRCVESTIRYCERRYGIKVHYYPHWVLAQAYKYAKYMPHYAAAQQLRDIKVTDIELAARSASGIEWLAYGHRMTDSLERRAMLHSFSGCDQKSKRAYPLWQWNAKDVYAYLRTARIPLPSRLGFAKQKNTSGVELKADVLFFIKKNFPDDFQKIKTVFPYVDALIMRHELRTNKQWVDKSRSK